MKTLGIIGGFGPTTTVAFCSRLVEYALATNPDCPPAFVVDFVSASPQLAGEAIRGSLEPGKILAEQVNSSMRRMEAMGIRTVALPCNGMHVFHEYFAVPSSMKFLHIVDGVLDRLRGDDIDRIGLLASGITVSSGLYAKRLSAAGIDCLVPSSSVQSRLNDAIAHFVKHGVAPEETKTIFTEAMREFQEQGASAIVLGCTDLSGMVMASQITVSLPCIDSMDVLAQTCASMI